MKKVEARTLCQSIRELHSIVLLLVALLAVVVRIVQSILRLAPFITTLKPYRMSTFINTLIPQKFLFKPKLAVYSHPACTRHDIPDHPEQPRRVKVILEAVQAQFDLKVDFREASLASRDTLKLFHTDRMITKFESNWNLTNNKFKESKKVIYSALDGGDTQIMYSTKDAALRAVGAVVDAIDHIYLPAEHTQRIDTAFCVIRPPGHHAETNRACGFCFFNNVAVGARYAQEKYGVKKVAILDFDVHHGNGHEEGFETDDTVFYGSTHEKDNFPGTGKDPSPRIGENATRERDRRIVDRYLHSGHGSRNEFYTKWIDILHEMERFQPELILISAGFDAHDDDPLSNIELIDSDYHWITRQILLSALKLSIAHKKEVPVISTLEGGYDLEAIARSAVEHVKALSEGFVGVADLLYSKEDEEKEEEGKEAKYGGDEVAALMESIEQMGLMEGSKVNKGEEVVQDIEDSNQRNEGVK